MKRWFSYDPNGDGLVFHDDDLDARLAAEKAIEEDSCGDEWPENITDICWGEVYGRVGNVTEDGDSLYNYALITRKQEPPK